MMSICSSPARASTLRLRGQYLAGKRRGSTETLIAVRCQYCNHGRAGAYSATHHTAKRTCCLRSNTCVFAGCRSTTLDAHRREDQRRPRRRTRGVKQGSTAVQVWCQRARLRETPAVDAPSRRTPALVGRASSSLRASERVPMHGTR